MEKITILIIDDHKLIMSAWSDILNSDERFLVIGKTPCAEDAFRMVTEQHPQVVLTDISMTPVDGFAITQTISGLSDISKVIGVSMYNIPAYARKLMKTGARGYVTKNSSIEELKMAILEVSKGHKYICQEIKEMLSAEHLEEEFPVMRPKLSHREIDVMRLVKEGLSSKEIGLELDISIKTVEVHRYNILKKLNLKNTAALINYMHEQGL